MSEYNEQQQGEQSMLPDISKQQVLLTGGTLVAGELAGWVADLAMQNASHNAMFMGLVVTGLVAYKSKTITKMLMPPSARETREKTDRIIEAVAPVTEVHPDQRVLSKLKRIVGLPSEPPTWPKDTSDDEDVYEPETPSNDVPTQRIAEPVAAIFGNYPDDETLVLGHVLANGAAFNPHIEGLFGKGLIASAVQGSGKSMLNKRIIEQAGKCGVPVVVFDHKGEYAPITELPFILGLRAGSSRLQEKVGPACYPLTATKDSADKLVALMMEGYYQVVIDLPSYGDGWLERASIVAEVGQALMRWSARQREIGGVLLPCLVFLDEAQLYIPQNINLLPPEAQKNREVLDNLSNAYFALVSNGRSNGYTVCFATQSLTYIAKWAIKSCQVKVFGRHTEKNDLDMCESIINGKVASREDIEAFKPGVAVVFGFTQQPMVIKFEKPVSRDESETPGIDRLRQRRTVKREQYYAPQPQQRSHDYQLNQVDALIAEVMGRPDVDPEDKRYAQPREQVAQHSYQPVQQTPRPTYERMPDLPPAQHRPSTALPRELQQTLDAYQPGMSYRDLAKELGIGKDTAGKYIQELKRRGLV